MKIAVFCSSRDNTDPQWIDDAAALGRWIGSGGHTLVYGGVARGLMKTVSDATRQAGGRSVGVVPVRRYGEADEADTLTIKTSSLAMRKEIMMCLADTFVALPGGYGTLDEVVSTLTALNFNSDSRTIRLLNSDGIFNPLREQLVRMLELGVMDPAIINRISFVSSIDILLRQLGALDKS